MLDTHYLSIPFSLSTYQLIWIIGKDIQLGILTVWASNLFWYEQGLDFGELGSGELSLFLLYQKYLTNSLANVRLIYICTAYVCRFSASILTLKTPENCYTCIGMKYTLVIYFQINMSSMQRQPKNHQHSDIMVDMMHASPWPSDHDIDYS